MAIPRKTAQGTWRIQIEVNGQRDSGTFDTKREAQDWNARRTLELKAAGKHGPGASKTLRDALRRYADEVAPTKRGANKEIIRLAAFERQSLPVNKKLQALTSEDVARWRDDRLTRNARGSVLRDLGLLSAVMEQARQEWKWISVNPVRDVKKPSNPDHRERIITRREVRAMLRQLGHGGPVRSVSQAVAACFAVALRTGMRAGELSGLEWSRVHADHVVLMMTKNGKRRDVPLTPQAQRAIERLRGWDGDRVFGVKSQTLDALFRRARDRAGLAGFTFHDSRHVAATALSKKLDVLTLCKVFGWSNPKMAMTYFNPTASEIARSLA